MSDTTYNGWRNYATWRVNLEIFDGWEEDEPVTEDSLRDYVEDLIDSYTRPDPSNPNFILGWAKAFIADVDWYTIAEHINEANQERFAEGDFWDADSDTVEEAKEDLATVEWCVK